MENKFRKIIRNYDNDPYVVPGCFIEDLVDVSASRIHGYLSAMDAKNESNMPELKSG